MGCTIVEFLTGKPPYHDLASLAAIFRIVQDDHPPLPKGLSESVKRFLLLCFQKDPSRRPTAKELLDDPWLKTSTAAANIKESELEESVAGLETSVATTIRFFRKTSFRGNLLDMNLTTKNNEERIESPRLDTVQSRPTFDAAVVSEQPKKIENMWLRQDISPLYTTVRSANIDSPDHEDIFNFIDGEHVTSSTSSDESANHVFNFMEVKTPPQTPSEIRKGLFILL